MARWRAAAGVGFPLCMERGRAAAAVLSTAVMGVGRGVVVVLPWRAVPGAYTFLVLLLGGVSMFRLVRRWSTATVAAMAGCLYVANPYMLFVAFERSAYAELLAAAWMPMLFGALLTRRVSVVKIALLVAVLWLTNAPACGYR